MFRLNALELFPEFQQAQYLSFSLNDYEVIAKALAKRVLGSLILDPWRSDSCYLLADGHQEGQTYGLYIFGIGRPDLTDLELCCTVEQVQELLDKEQSSVSWFPNKEELYNNFTLWIQSMEETAKYFKLPMRNDREELLFIADMIKIVDSDSQ